MKRTPKTAEPHAESPESNRMRHWCTSCYDAVCTETSGAHCPDCHRCQKDA